tara:strand:- start:4821 stop:5960 length:1140 start_codon:yes stop_codon:yes gene_type:complete
MFFDFLSPIDETLMEFKESLPESSIGKKIIYYKKNKTDFSKIDIALIGLNEYRGANDSKLNYFKTNSLRKELYLLFRGNWTVDIIDLGDVINGNKLSDTYYATKIISQYLVKNNVIPVFIGGSQDLTFPIYQSYCSKGIEINLTLVDNKFDLGQIKKEFSDLSFVSQIIMEKKNELNHYANIGFQTFLNSQEEIDLLEKMQFDYFRLGLVDKKISSIEPCLRNTDIVSVDFKSVKSSELNFAHNYPNGFKSNQICTISRYAGLSSRVSSIGIFDIFDNDISYALASQVIWYFIEGFSLRIKEDPYSKNFKGNSYHVIVDNQDLKFYESELSQKWWLELKKNNNNSNIKSLIPCNYQDYLDAKNEKFSDRIMLSLKRNFV